MAPGAGTASALNWKLSKRLLPDADVAPVKVKRTYAVVALSSKDVVEREITPELTKESFIAPE